MNVFLLVSCLVLAYLLGAVPFSLIIGRQVRGIDLRHHGSGNLGATNVYRTLGPWWGGLCLLLDAGKGALAVVLMTLVVHAWPARQDLPLHFTPDLYRIIAGALAILGHNFSPFAGFRGGKGIATSFGVCLVLEPFPTLVVTAIFIIVFLAARIVSVASLAAAAVFPWAVVFFEWQSPRAMSQTLVIFSAVLALLVIWRHRANIRRLQEGTERPLQAPPRDDDQGEDRP